jgi:hypothetical protein
VNAIVSVRLGTALFAATLLAACSASAAASSPTTELSGPAILVATADYMLDTKSSSVTLPKLAGSSDSFVVTYPPMSAATTLNVSVADGPSSFAIPRAQAIWAPKCPWPLETIGMVFANSETLTGTPQISFSTPRIDGSPTYFDAVLADSTAGTIVAQKQIPVPADMRPDAGVIPSMLSSWNVVAGHQYVMEIVSSTSPFLTCSGIYN